MSSSARPIHVNVSSALRRNSKHLPITVVSANLWHDWPRHRQLAQRLETFAQLVETKSADILLLQEVAWTHHLRADKWLSERLGMDSLYSRANGHKEAMGFEEGLAVISRFPLQSHHLEQLSTDAYPFVRRFALGASVNTPSGELYVFSAHLGFLRSQNSKQFDKLHNWVSEIAGGTSAIIGGDFNIHEGAPEIARVRGAWLDTYRHLNSDGDGATHELRCPWGKVVRRQRLDYIFLRPGENSWRVVESQVLEHADVPHSDHKAVLTRLTGEWP